MNRHQLNKAIFTLGASEALLVLTNTAAVAIETNVNSNSEYVPVRIGLITVGGADDNTLVAIARGLPYVTRTIAIDTDARALIRIEADKSIAIGCGVDRPMHSRQAYKQALRQAADIEEAMHGLDLVFIVAGMFGVAGKGIAPVVAAIARRMRIATFGIAIAPAKWQGVQSNPSVRYAVQEFQRAGATVFPIKSQRMAEAMGEDAPCVSQIVRSLLTSVSHATNQFEIVGIELPELQKALAPGGIAAIGFGSAAGVQRVEGAVQRAIEHPQLGLDRLLIATGVLVNVRGATGLHFSEVNQVWRLIRSKLTLDPWLLYSGAVDESAGDQLIVSILATMPEPVDSARA